jgi:hypothetical protein
VAVSAAVLITLAGYTSQWDLRTRWGLRVFGFLLVLLSLALSIRVDAFTLAGRARRGRSQVFNRADSRSRLVKFILGGVVVPIAVLTAANLVVLPNHQTPLSMAIGFRLARPGNARAEKLASAVLRAPSSGARVEGILALQGLRSAEAMDQLLRILQDDPNALKGSEAQALSSALAAYGADAKSRLLQRFRQLDPRAPASAAPPADMYERYFAADYDAAKRELEAQKPAASNGDVERLLATRAPLQQALGRIEADSPNGAGSASLPVFILQTFLKMDLTEDRDLIALARTTAADGAWPDEVRGQALLLMAKVGGKDDLDALYDALDSASPSLRARALQAIVTLQARLSAAAPR